MMKIRNLTTAEWSLLYMLLNLLLVLAVAYGFRVLLGIVLVGLLALLVERSVNWYRGRA